MFGRGPLLAQVGLALLLCSGWALFPLQAADETTQSDPTSGYHTESFRGKVVWLTEGLARRHGVKAVPEAKERILALETEDGRFHPVFEDVRGRAFRRDARLRGVPAELLARRYDGSPFLHIIRVYLWEDGKRYEVDYWCDICSITMFELKDCECCQGPIELRKQLSPP